MLCCLRDFVISAEAPGHEWPGYSQKKPHEWGCGRRGRGGRGRRVRAVNRNVVSRLLVLWVVLGDPVLGEQEEVFGLLVDLLGFRFAGDMRRVVIYGVALAATGLEQVSK